jgi:Glycosyl transferase family 2
MAERITAILTVKDEGAQLVEWLAHHRAVGVTDVLVFSNDCSDGTDTMLDRLDSAGWLTHIPQTVGPKGAQWQALATAARHPLVTGADWAICLDIDEFIVVTTGDGTIPALLAACPEADAICLTWRMYGNPGVLARDGADVRQTFTRSAPAVLHWPWQAQMVKTLYRPAVFARPGVHRPRGRGRSVDGAGRPVDHDRLFAPLGQDTGTLGRINHYALGSFHDFVLKAARGRANRQGSPVDAGYWVARNFCAVEDRAALATAIAGPAAERAAELAALLGPLHQAAVDWRRRRLAALLTGDVTGDGPRLLLSQVMLAGPTRLLSPAGARAIWGGKQ